MSTVVSSTTRSGDWQLRRQWSASSPWAVVLVLHGLNEHSGRYEHVGEHLAGAGLEVRAHDHRGHGRTWGRRSYLEDFTDFLDDVEDHIVSLREEFAGLPLVLLGHSMGGLISHAYCVDGRPAPDLLVTTGAALAPVGVPDWQKKLASVMARMLPKVRVGGKIDPEILSRDPDVQAGYVHDPLVPVGVTAALGQSLLDGMERHRRDRERLAVPALVLHGADDVLVPPAATEVMLGIPGVDRRLLPGLRHEVLNEPGFEELLDEIVGWVRERLDAVA